MRIGLSRAPFTAALLIAIAIVWFAELADAQSMLEKGAIVTGMLREGQYHRLLTGMFLHGGWMHWLANSWTLYQLGMLYEAMFGSRRFGLVYFASGLVASLASAVRLEMAAMPGASVGASGAILGILGAFFFSIRRSPQWRHQPWTKSLLNQLMFWGFLNLAIGFSAPNLIDNTAHVAGLVTGLLLGFIPHRVPPPPPGDSVVDVQAYEDSTLRQNQP